MWEESDRDSILGRLGKKELPEEVLFKLRLEGWKWAYHEKPGEQGCRPKNSKHKVTGTGRAWRV